jgi:mannose-6-phosphate isomerase-like protein (cupin superfamily)
MDKAVATRFDGSTGPRIVGPTDGKAVDLGSLGVRFMIWAEETGGEFSLVEHPIPPRHLCAPLHRHSREDEYSFVLEGRMGAQLGDDVVYAEVGDLAFKPRGQWHTFWNAGDTPCRILEMIAPGGFERFFEELSGGSDSPDDIGTRYGIEFDPDSVPRLCEEHGLVFPMGA